MRVIRALLLTVALACGSAQAEQSLAVYVEYGGKVIELVSTHNMEWYWEGETIYTAFEADDILTPATLQSVGDSLRIIGWNRRGDTITIFFTLKDRVELPASEMKWKFVDLISVESDDEETRLPYESSPSPLAS